MKLLSPIYERDMGDAMISRACANFLAGTGLAPEQFRLGGALTMTDVHQIAFVRSRERSAALVPIEVPGLIAGELKHRPGRDRALLGVYFNKFCYSETLDGFSRLTLFGYELPDAVCRSYSKRNLRLSEVIDLDGEQSAFLRKADPTILTLRNVRNDAAGSVSLSVRLRDYWSLAHWDFGSVDSRGQ